MDIISRRHYPVVKLTLRCQNPVICGRIGVRSAAFSRKMFVVLHLSEEKKFAAIVDLQERNASKMPSAVVVWRCAVLTFCFIMPLFNAGNCKPNCISD